MQNISLVQFESLLGCVNLRSPFGPRDHAMLRLAAFTGLRVAELVGLNVSEVWHAGQVRSTLFVRPAIAKGGRGRSVPMCLIEAAAFLHQFQRKGGQLPDGTPYIEARLADYRLAYELARQVLRATFHELSRSARDLWELVLPWAEGQAGGRIEDFCFTRRDVRSLVDWPDRRVLDALTELSEMEYLFVASGNQGRAYQYRVLAASGAAPCPLHDLTTPEELERLGVR